ncbi:hypothetical protein L0663_17415 [Dyadobacter sp. CY107]|uniref:hypothetical protein n=1 Tax=Dyadobacter fanqingshengii TaxID=2906443 RepID=UPI001F42A613|nr:hypothetical protein [Dyadobacter fanqingshengii]MCF2505178.1 hypothetical protein [Dyadobacter fanqingshengii]
MNMTLLETNIRQRNERERLLSERELHREILRKRHVMELSLLRLDNNKPTLKITLLLKQAQELVDLSTYYINEWLIMARRHEHELNDLNEFLSDDKRKCNACKIPA